jgi:uncharacterized protein
VMPEQEGLEEHPAGAASGALCSDYWKRCAEGELTVQRCRSCRSRQFPPVGHCRHCLSADTILEPWRGTASLYSFSLVHRAARAELQSYLPFCLALVDLGEGMLMESWIVDWSEEQLVIGAELELTFRELNGRVLPMFFVSQYKT